MSDSVFVSKPKRLRIEYDSIIKTIPQNSFTEPQKDQINKTETRWRFFQIGDKNMVEVNRKTPNGVREYLKRDKWIVYEVDNSFDSYVTKQYYYYSD